MNGLLRADRVVCPLREAAEKASAAARAAAALLKGDGRSTSSSMSSSDLGAGSAASDVTLGSGSEPDVLLWGLLQVVMMQGGRPRRIGVKFLLTRPLLPA